ncbi:MAG: DUF2202 domain-containing protein [Verrucomicrobia bacterium]|nr:DUF2202 domain-containing protein [Verrucomicrobiota bacterium]
MKTSSLLFLASASLALAANGPANRGAVAGNNSAADTCGDCTQTCDGPCAVASTATTPVSLSAAAQTALLFQIEEERMAGELYRAFNAKWNLRPFAAIPQAEARHESMLKQLAGRAALTVPAAVAGRFVSPEVQQRYDALLALGLESADSALRAAAFVEEQDVADLRTLAATTDSADLKTIVSALEQASGHHLSAFTGLLAARGVTYVPQVLSAEDFAKLSASAPGHGKGAGMGAGMSGRGYRGGR